MAALSKLVKVGDFYARVANRCRHIDNFVLDEQALLEIAKMEILANFSAANSSLRKYYHTKDAIALDGAAVAKEATIDISAKNYFDVTNVSYGMSKMYHPAKSVTEFVNVQSDEAHQTLSEGRYWFLEQGGDLILIFAGTVPVAADAEKTLNIWHVRYPALTDLTLTAVAANTAYIDVPDFMIAFFYIATAIAAIKEQNLSVPDNLANEMTTVIANLSDKLTKEEMAIAQAKVDNLTS